MGEDQQGRVHWDRLLDQARKAHQNHAALRAFCSFPDDVRAQNVAPFPIKAAQLMLDNPGFSSDRFAGFRDAFLAAGEMAQWRETYKDTDIGQDFMDRFACYCLIGEGGAFHSDQMWSWVVYMPPHLYYPWHHHPGEEMYMTLAGEAVFMRHDQPDAILRAGDVSQHASNQPHAMETHAHPVMAYVVWRNGFDTAPVLSGGV